MLNLDGALNLIKIVLELGDVAEIRIIILIRILFQNLSAKHSYNFKYMFNAMNCVQLLHQKKCEKKIIS